MKELTIVRSGGANEFIKRRDHRICSLHITNFCNFHCSYCVIKDNLDSAQWSRETLFKNLDWICKDGKTTSLLLFGGEPLIHPDFLDAVAKCKAEMNCQLSTMTNASASLSFFKKIYTLDPEFKTTVSLHFEKLRIESFLEKAAFLASQKQGARFKIMLHPQFRTEAYKIAEKLNLIVKGTKSRISCAMIRFPKQHYNTFSPEYNNDDWDFYHSVNKNNVDEKSFIEFVDTSGQRYIVRDKYEMLLKAGLLQFPQMLCLVNSWKCIFDRNGNVRKHVCLAGKRASYKAYGEPLYCDMPITCKSRHCWCSGHMSVPKSLHASGMPLHAGGDTPKGIPLKIKTEDILVQTGDNSPRFLLREPS